MKTSSKLLILVGAVMFVLPLSIIAFAMLPGRVSQEAYEKNMGEEIAKVGTADQYLQTKILKPFHKVLIKGEGRSLPIDLIIVKSDQYALKFQKNRAIDVQFDVDDQGMLTIHGEVSTNYYYDKVYLFVPALYDIELQDVDLHTQIDTDSLRILGNRVRGFRMLPGTKIGNLQLRLKNSTMELSEYERDEEPGGIVDNLILDLDSTRISLLSQNWKQMTLQAKNSSVNLIQHRQKVSVDDLKISTEGANTIKLDSLQVHAISGTVSDQTIIDLPIYQLRKLIQNK